MCLLMVLVRVFIASFHPGKKGNNGQSIQVRSFINPLDDDINWLLRLRDKAGQRLLIEAGSEARDCHEATKLRNIAREGERWRVLRWMRRSPGSPLGRALTIRLIWVLCQFASHRLDLGRHSHSQSHRYDKLIYHILEKKTFDIDCVIAVATYISP